MAEKKQYELKDAIRFQVVKDYNGRAHPIRNFDTKSEALEFAKQTAHRENRGMALTVRVYEQVHFVRVAKKAQNV